MDTINRYQRQTVLKDFGPLAQQKLKEARVLVIGAGGLGIPVLSYLNAMGVGTLGIVEGDLIEMTNLQRQVLYTEADLGKSKLEVVLSRLQAQNSETFFKPYATFLTPENALEIIASFDLVVDGSDNFPTRYLINDACVILQKPFVSGAIQSFEGQLGVFNYMGGPTYRCLFPTVPQAMEIPNCNQNGVLGVIPGIIGNLQALEVVKIITGIGEVLSGRLLLFDGLRHDSRTIRFERLPGNNRITELQESYGAGACEPEDIIGVGAFLQTIRLGTEIRLIDVRSPAEYDAQPFWEFPATNIPLDQVLASAASWDHTRPVYLLCQSGQRSEAALRLLKDQHPDRAIYSISGGINGFLNRSQ